MITLELLTDFLHEHLRYNKDIICDSFAIHNKMLDIKVINLSKSVRGFGEVVKLERYYNWLSEKRDEKINQII